MNTHANEPEQGRFNIARFFVHHRQVAWALLVAMLAWGVAGRGMALEILSRVGTPFFTTREDGTGLGVVLARAVFEQHGGTLRYTSAPGRGTTAVGTLPAVTAN